MKKIIIVSLLFITALFMGCAKKPITESYVEGETQATQPPVGEDIVDDISTKITDTDSLENELNDSDFGNLDKDMASIDW